jgi:hypothetical protein
MPKKKQTPKIKQLTEEEFKGFLGKVVPKNKK